MAKRSRWPVAAVVAAATLAGGWGVAEDRVSKPDVATPGRQPAPSGANQVATLGGGCFWCMEAVFERKEGVLSVISGYAGGSSAEPSYEEVCTGTTGHAEVVQIEFDPARVSFEEILELFWKSHDPTTPNRQGADVGTQYRSVIFYHSDAQRKVAERSRERLVASRTYRSPVVTEILPLGAFYRAEEYHQDYFDKNPTAGYCRVVIAPKLRKLELPLAPRSPAP